MIIMVAMDCGIRQAITMGDKAESCDYNTKHGPSLAELILELAILRI